MKTKHLSWSLALLMGLVAACKSRDNTGIVVEVWSDLAVPSQLGSIRVDVLGPTATSTQVFSLTGQSQLPVRLAVVPRAAKDASITVRATGLFGTTEVVQQSAQVAFVPGSSKLLKLILERSCANRRCLSTQSCSAGECVAIPRISDLPDFDPKATPGQPDAGARPSVDGGHDAGGDGAAEAGVKDASPDRSSDRTGADGVTIPTPDAPIGIDGAGGSMGTGGAAGGAAGSDAGGASDPSTATGGAGGVVASGGTGLVAGGVAGANGTAGAGGTGHTSGVAGSAGSGVLGGAGGASSTSNSAGAGGGAAGSSGSVALPPDAGIPDAADAPVAGAAGGASSTGGAGATGGAGTTGGAGSTGGAGAAGGASSSAIVSCDSPVAPTNGSVDFTGNTVGSTATFKCDSGYHISGQEILTCQSTGLWDGTAPTCQLTTLGMVCWSAWECPADSKCCDGSDASCLDTGLTGISTPSSQFQICPDGTTVTDALTGLVWQRTPDEFPAGCSGQYCTWAQAVDYCKNLSLAGSTWRLPSVKELTTIVQYTLESYSSSALKINQMIFSGTTPDSFWTSTSVATTYNSVWQVSFSSGIHMSARLNDPVVPLAKVRCVH